MFLNHFNLKIILITNSINKMKQLIVAINDIQNKKYIKQKETLYIKDNFEIIKKYTADKETKYIDTTINIISKQNIKADDRKKLIQMNPLIISTIKKYYHEEYNDNSNDDDITANLTPNEIEKKLDSNIPKYNKFNETHPMEGISYDPNNNRWRFNMNNINKAKKNYNEIIAIAKENY